MKCAISTLDIVDFWGNSCIDTNVKLKEYTQNTNHKFKNTSIKLKEYTQNTNHQFKNTSIKLKEYTNDIIDTNNTFKKRLKLKSNKYQRLQYNNEKAKEIKKNNRNGR